MLKFKWALLVPYVSHNRQASACNSHLLFINSIATSSLNGPHTSTSRLNSFEKPDAVVRFLKALGFTETQVQLTVKRLPRILFADVEKTLKPKIAFFQEWGLCGPRLGMMISKNPVLLTSSLDKRLKPGIGAIKEVFELAGSENSSGDCISDVLFCILSRQKWLISGGSRLRSNVTFLRNCGMVGSQLIMLLKSQGSLFLLREAELKSLVSLAVEKGFVMGSKMLPYGVMVLYANSAETFNRKFRLLESFGFTKDECNVMFLKSPFVFKCSEDKLRRGIDFLMHTLMLDKSVLVGSPTILGLSVEKRMIPRCKILEMIKSRSLLKREPSFHHVLMLANKKFVEKYILRFSDDDGIELKVAYEKFLSGSS